MKFRQAVGQASAPASSGYRSGLAALTPAHRSQVSCRNPRNLTGSIDLDTCLRHTSPHDRAHRWDYGIGYKAGNGDEEAHWVEVHPAVTGEVDRVVSKLQWLKEWLRREGRDLQDLTPTSGYHWLATDSGVHIRPGTREARKLALAGLTPPRRVLRLP